MQSSGPPVASFQFSHDFAAENKGNIADFYDLDKKAIGEGSYGQVYTAKTKGSPKGSSDVYAVKKMKKSAIKEVAKLKNEVQIQNALDHPNIAKLYEFFSDGNYYYLVMEMCTGGELFDRIIDAAENSGKEGEAFSERMVATYMTQILGAFFYMHSNGYVHRDIKPENFLMQSKAKDAEIKVIDFGLGKHNPGGGDMRTKAGTPYYVAPQVLAGKYDHKCDIWSCGVITYILTCGYPPFYGDRDSDILNMVKSGKFDFPEDDWGGRSKALKDFITRMLTMSPAQRPEAAELLKDTWLTERQTDDTRPLDAKAFSNLKKFHESSRLKKLAVTLIAQEVNSSQLQELKQTFKGLDTDNDGMVSQEEIQQAISALKEKGNLSFDVDALATYLAKLDTDGSGKIDWSEFVASMMDKKNYETEAALWRAFQKLDLDHDGFITKAELKTVLSGASDDMGEDGLRKIAGEVEKIMKESDTNGDDRISFDEFKASVNL